MKVKLNKRNERKLADLIDINKTANEEDKLIQNQIKYIANGHELKDILNGLKKTDKMVNDSLNNISNNEKQVDRYCRKKYGHSLDYMSKLSDDQYLKMRKANKS